MLAGDALVQSLVSEIAFSAAVQALLVPEKEAVSDTTGSALGGRARACQASGIAVRALGPVVELAKSAF